MVQIIRRNRVKEPVYIPPIEPVEYDNKPIKKRIAIWDSETDPFAYGREVKPFTCGVYFPDNEEYYDFWGDNGKCIDLFFNWLSNINEKLCFFVHNGGNFDFYFFIDYFDKGHKPFIINGRLVQIEAGGHEWRDSYSMIPVALATYDKIKIDYSKFEEGMREQYKEEILAYQKRDCTALAELVVEWLNMFGNKTTMASVALSMLNSYHGFECLTEPIDRDLRKYYFGGRNQCFETGVLRGNFKVFDINSSYPNVMHRYSHPVSSTPFYEKYISKRTAFAHIRAYSDGALPIRNPDGGLSFPIGKHDFYASIHEINAGIETGTLKIDKVYCSIYFEQYTNFSEFIDEFYALRLAASANKDEIRKLFYKLVMNSSYGKFAQDPRKYKNWIFAPEEAPTPEYCDACYQYIVKNEPIQLCSKCLSKETSPYGWFVHSICNSYPIYAQSQRVKPKSFFNVATAASITGAARASIIYGLAQSTRPIYTDTDSIICENLEPGKNVFIDEKQLGAWKCESDGDTCAIAGKKLYAIWKNGKCIKKASKGVKLNDNEILRVAQGETVEYPNPAPKFSFKGTQFVTRNIKATA